MRWARHVAGLAALFLFGCQVVLGIEDSHLRAESTTSSTGAAGTGGAAGAEDCGNGVDDNGDGAVDCEDEQCADHTCVNLPAGWLGPIQIAAGSTATSCLSSTSTTFGGTGQVTFDLPECNSCQCNELAGDCTATVQVYTSSDCSGGPSETGSGSGCFDLNPPLSPTLAGGIASTTGTYGGCEPTGGGPTSPIEPPVFDTPYQYCDLPVGQGCGTGRCLPRVGSHWMGPCIYQHADVDCDAQPFTDKLALQTIQTDDRGCTECTCELAVPCNEAYVMVFAGNGCTGAPESILSGQGCQAFQSPQEVQSGFLSEGSCDAAGGEPHGDVTLQVTTVCCADLR